MNKKTGFFWILHAETFYKDGKVSIIAGTNKIHLGVL